MPKIKSLKITVLFGSPHGNGTTFKVLNKFLDNIDFKKEIDFFDAYKINPLPCYDCGYCKNKFVCKNHDLDKFFECLSVNDFLIIASPIYNGAFPSTMKSILDRFQHLYYGKVAGISDKDNFIKKNCIFITVQGSNKLSYNDIIAYEWSSNLKLLNYGVAGFLNVRNTDGINFDIDKFYKKSENEIYELIGKCFKIKS